MAAEQNSCEPSPANAGLGRLQLAAADRGGLNVAGGPVMNPGSLFR
jgi:hypothetical protein